MEEILIHTDYIQLDQFLKWCGIAASGGNAKEIIEEGMVRVNNTVIMQRSKKLTVGDVIEIKDNGIFKITKEGV